MLEESQVGKKLSGIFRGQVISHLPCGRCKVYVPDVYPEEWLKESVDLKDVYGQNLKGAKLPDAEQATSLFGGGVSGNGMFSYPKLNSYVWCMFERNDINKPIYFASVIDTTDMASSNSFILCTTNSENGKNLKHVIKCGKASVTIDEAGSIKIETDGSSIMLNGSQVLINAKDINMTVSNNITLVGENGISLTGSNLDLTSSFKIKNMSQLYEVQAPVSCRINNHEFATE